MVMDFPNFTIKQISAADEKRGDFTVSVLPESSSMSHNHHQIAGPALSKLLLAVVCCAVATLDGADCFAQAPPVEPSQSPFGVIRNLLKPGSQKPEPNSRPDSAATPGNQGWTQPRDPDSRTNDSQLKLPRSINVPMQDTPLPERSTVLADGNLLTLVVRDGSLGAILNSIAEKMGLNVVSAGDISGNVSITLRDVPLNNALDAILSVNGYRWTIQNNIIMVSSLSGDTRLSPRVQGRQVKVFRLDFASANDINTTIQDLLSPVGKSNVTEVSSEDKRRTREEIVVEDLPEYLVRIDSYIRQADRPPQQVLIEAHILQVQLRDDNRHGVDLSRIARIANADVSFQTNGIANLNALPGFLLNIEGSRVGSLIEVLQGTTDAKTLASPKVLAVNGQEARIQIGEQLGYLTTTTTQTSTLQDVQFIDLGVVLTVTPIISRDGRILMTVKPEVSSGRINTQTGLPDSETTEVATTVLLPNGHAMVIGGLIQEENSDQQSKLPIAGDIPVLGKLFQRRNRVKDRSEIIIALTPRIVPYGDEAQLKHLREVQRATSPLTCGPLIPTDRTEFEPKLRNANEYCEPLGNPISHFPSQPVAYSNLNPNPVTAAPLEFRPRAQKLAPVPGFLPSAEEFQAPVINQMSYTNSARTQRRLGSKKAGSSNSDGWQASGRR